MVLYRDPTSSSVMGTAAGPFHLSFTNPADGYSSSDDAQVQSATLTYFAPGASGTTPGSPAQAFLVLGIQSSYPSVPYGQPGSGHFFSGFSPLAGNRLTFTPAGSSAASGTADSADFSSTSAANDDDGIFDARLLLQRAGEHDRGNAQRPRRNCDGHRVHRLHRDRQRGAASR